MAEYATLCCQILHGHPINSKQVAVHHVAFFIRTDDDGYLFHLYQSPLNGFAVFRITVQLVPMNKPPTITALILQSRGREQRVAPVFETHVHADHLSAAPYLKKELGGQLGIGQHITTVQKVFGSLGVYSADFLDSLGPRPAANQAVSDFQAALQACSAGVAQRNATPVRAKRQYPFLDPANLPNSTNI